MQLLKLGAEESGITEIHRVSWLLMLGAGDRGVVIQQSQLSQKMMLVDGK